MEAIRTLNNTEVDEYETLLSSLAFVSSNRSDNQPVLSLISTGILMVRSFYNFPTKNDSIKTKFPYWKTWKINAPP